MAASLAAKGAVLRPLQSLRGEGRSRSCSPARGSPTPASPSRRGASPSRDVCMAATGASSPLGGSGRNTPSPQLRSSSARDASISGNSDSALVRARGRASPDVVLGRGRTSASGLRFCATASSVLTELTSSASSASPVVSPHQAQTQTPPCQAETNPTTPNCQAACAPAGAAAQAHATTQQPGEHDQQQQQSSGAGADYADGMAAMASAAVAACNAAATTAAAYGSASLELLGEVMAESASNNANDEDEDEACDEPAAAAAAAKLSGCEGQARVQAPASCGTSPAFGPVVDEDDGAAASSSAATATPAAGAAPTSPSATRKHLIKMLARAGADVSKLAQVLSCPLDGLSNIAADSGTELLYKRLVVQAANNTNSGTDPAAATAAIAGFPAAAAAAGAPPPINHVHARVLSVLLSVLLSRAGSATGVYDLVPGLPQLLAQGGGSEIVRALSIDPGDAEMAAMRTAAAGAMAQAPPLKASDAEDAVAGGAVAASAAVRAIMRAGSTATAVVPDLGNILDGVLGSVHDSIDEFDHATPRAGVVSASRTHDHASA